MEDRVETFVVLSHQELFGAAPSEASCLAHLQGCSFVALTQYVGILCHNLAVAAARGASLSEFHDFQRCFIEQLAPEPFKGELFQLVASAPAFADGRWVLADEHRAANLVAAYARANPPPVTRPGGPADLERLFRAQLIINDLLAPASREDDEDGAAVVLHMFSMTRDWSAEVGLPRAFDLFARRLADAVPGLNGSVRRHFGASPAEIVSVLAGVYQFEMLSVLSEAPPGFLGRKPDFTRGILTLDELQPTHAGSVVVRRVLDEHTSSWAELHRRFAEVPLSDPSVLWFLRHPLIAIDDHRTWCFDPALLLSAASGGLFWLMRDAFVADGGRGDDLVRTLGKPVFEGYVRDLLGSLSLADSLAGDAETPGEGLPDFYFREGDGVLVAIEAKAPIMTESVKWSADAATLREELTKVAKKNQLMNATERLFRHKPKSVAGVRRVFPVILVLDPAFAAPGIEAELRAAVVKPSLGCEVGDIQVLTISDLECAGNYVARRSFAGLLSARHKSPAGLRYPLASFISSQRELIERECGDWLPPFDAHQATRKALALAMSEAFDRFAPPGRCPEARPGPATGVDPGAVADETSARTKGDHGDAH